MFDVNPSLIRFWEQKFDILKPDKNKKGNRLFTPKDVENLKLIYHLVKENGMTLSGAQKRLRQNPDGLKRDLEIIDRLQHIRAMLLEVRQELKGSGEDTEVFVDTDVESYGESSIPGAEAVPSISPISAEEVPSLEEESDFVPDPAFDAEVLEEESAPLVPFSIQELWTEQENPRLDPEELQEAHPEESVPADDPEPEVAPEPSVPAAPQVIEQTLF